MSKVSDLKSIDDRIVAVMDELDSIAFTLTDVATYPNHYYNDVVRVARQVSAVSKILDGTAFIYRSKDV